MSPTRAEALANLLHDLMSSSAEIEGAALVSADGLPMASALPPTMDDERLSAMTAAMLSLGDRAAQELGRGSLNQIFVEGSHGYVFLMSAGPAVLCAVTNTAAKIGLVLFEMRRASAYIGSVLTSDGMAAPASLMPHAESAS